jgi:hypothetical protein
MQHIAFPFRYVCCENSISYCPLVKDGTTFGGLRVCGLPNSQGDSFILLSGLPSSGGDHMYSYRAIALYLHGSRLFKVLKFKIIVALTNTKH